MKNRSFCNPKYILQDLMGLSILSAILLFLVLINIPSHAEAKNNHKTLLNSYESMTKGLNLSSGNDANIFEEDPLAGDESDIVEKPFHLPFDANYETDGLTVEDFGHYAGYYKLKNTKGARIFYYFFESRKNKTEDPVVVWLSGGPGCSSSLALFYENGPFQLMKNLSLVWNDYGWDKVSNIIYVDQPTGTGFSYSTNKDDTRIGSDEAAVDFYEFIQVFFEKHPKLANNPFYITGESYAGHYIPAFASLIHKANKNKQGPHVNLKGIAIGNGDTNPAIQYKAYPDYALQMKLINESQYKETRQLVSTCQSKVQNGCHGTKSSSACAQAKINCDNIYYYIAKSMGDKNIYDIRKKCEGDLCYDFSNMERFLAKASVKIALGVPERVNFASCSNAVYDAMAGDWMLNFAVDIPELLENGIKLLVYVGEYDFICNWIGNFRWVSDMIWSGHNYFLTAHNVKFNVDGVEAGWSKSYGNLTYLTVKDAGHLVPMDQPKAALEMLSKWMHSLPL